MGKHLEGETIKENVLLVPEMGKGLLEGRKAFWVLAWGFLNYRGWAAKLPHERVAFEELKVASKS